MNDNQGSDEAEFDNKWSYIPGIKNFLRFFRIGGCTMIVGPPGCGKTEMVNDIIAETKMTKIVVGLRLLAQLLEIEHSREDYQGAEKCSE
jgi:ABC-type lipoprotein export system ATPase subunit